MLKNQDVLQLFEAAEKEATLDFIYDEMKDVERDKNPFISPESELPYEYFCKKYVFNPGKTTAEQEKMWDCLVDVQEATRKQAFKAGYDMAKNFLSAFLKK